MIDYISDEEDVKDILRTPFSGVISDATYPSGGRVHPRVYGTFARLIEKYVVQERVLTLEQAVHKVTGHAADRFGFEKKGVIAAGPFTLLARKRPRARYLRAAQPACDRL